jgi:O-antigen/teichoic acid export membrane protein
MPRRAGAWRPRPGTLLDRFGTGVAFNLVGVVFNQGSTLLTNMLVARVLGAQSFGQYEIVLSTLQSLSSFAGLGMGYTATRYLPEYRARDLPRAGRILGLCLTGTAAASVLFALALVVLAPVLSDRLLHAPQLTPLLRIGAGVVVFTAFTGLLTGVLAGVERYRDVAAGGVGAGVGYVVLIVGGAHLGGTRGAVVGLLLSGVLQVALLGVLSHRALSTLGLRPTGRGAWAERAILPRFVLPALISGLTAVPALWLVQVALARGPRGFTELAHYSASYTMAMVVLLLPNVSYNVGMSLINHARGTGSARDYRQVFWLNAQFTAGVVFLGALVMAAVGRPILRLYGPEFSAALPALLLLLASTVPEALTIAMFQLVQANDRLWSAVLRINIPRDLLIPILAFSLAPRFGAAGAAAAYLAGRVTGFLLSAHLCHEIGLDLQEQRTSTALDTGRAPGTMPGHDHAPDA